MKVVKIMTANGNIYHWPLYGFPDAEQIELVEMTRDEYHAIPANSDTMDRGRASIAD